MIQNTVQSNVENMANTFLDREKILILKETYVVQKLYRISGMNCIPVFRTVLQRIQNEKVSQPKLKIYLYW